jgi:hypothetical protein
MSDFCAAPNRFHFLWRALSPKSFTLFISSLFRSKDGTEKARSQAAQRLRTPEGWAQFNQWLKKAQEEKDRKKITSLLELCIEVCLCGVALVTPLFV